jgi:lipopolysaccharide transport system ATP-binding protein
VTSSEVAIRVAHLRKRYRVGMRPGYELLGESLLNAMRRRRHSSDGSVIWAIDDVSFDVRAGEVLGLIGRNGAGKSTLLKILSRITEPTAGRVELYGRIGSLLEVGTGFHPELTGRENVFLNGAILGMKRVEINRKLDAILEFSGVERYIDTPLKFYSTGMAVRLGFAVAAHLEPEILVVDEVLAVGDLAFQERCLGKMKDVAESGRTVLFVSHNMSAISAICPEAIVLDCGRLVFRGPASEAIATYVRLARATTAELAGRVDRRGSGTARVTAWQLEDVDGLPVDSARAGETLRLALDFEVSPAVRADELVLNVVVSAADGRRLFALASELGDGLGEPAARGRAVCTIPRLPLMPGHYDFQVSLLLGRELADKIERAGTFVVTPGPFFPSHRLPASIDAFGPLLVDHEWSIEPRGRVPARASGRARAG